MFKTVVLVALTFVACSLIRPEKADIFEIDSGTHSNIEDSGAHLIKSELELNEFWEMSHPGANRIRMPKVNFEETNIVILTAGLKRSGGYKMKLQEYTLNGNKAFYQIDIIPPIGPATMATTTPFKIFEVPKRVESVTVNFNTIRKEK